MPDDFRNKYALTSHVHNLKSLDVPHKFAVTDFVHANIIDNHGFHDALC